MEAKPLTRVLIGLSIALPLAALTAAFTGTTATPAPESEGPPCLVCHESTHEVWEQGAHGQALEDPVFREAWQAQGEPGQCLTCHASAYDPVVGEVADLGVTCIACHGEYIQGHPAEPMPTYPSATTCDQCHLETHFQWKASRHSQVEMACVACHDPHGADIRAATPSELCGSCHQTKASGFAHNVHSTAGLTCADCHLEPPHLEGDDVHAARNHTFNVSLSACTECHDFHTHEDWDMASDVEAEPPDVTTASAEVGAEPDPVSPVGYASLVGLFGFTGGMILTPWLENLFRRRREK